MKKVYFGIETNMRFNVFAFVSIILLGLSVLGLIYLGQWYFTVLLVLSVILNLFWIVLIMSSIKTRIELDETYVRAPFFVWYEGFRSKMESKIFYEEMPYDSILSIEVIDVDDLITKKMIKALKIEVKDSFPHVLLLDRFKGEELDAFIALMYGKVQVNQS